MLTHFQFKPLYENNQMPGWRFSFYYQKQKLTGIYYSDGKIEWTGVKPPSTEEEATLFSRIHELMLYHVYD
ncbi:YheE family protein [Cytobacillus spongiae]|uniref:YheE family protein n=1 Tax=Cytobacillus spongiae TaxID=2901381 RepID=UPI001F23F2B4|nr:YheE family protein [Cytobacillus spongiae]UII56852.1 YheE family protein [Cytobacillus spongiae]